MGIKTISFSDRCGNVVFQGKLTSLPLKDERIIEKSIEMFHDSEPCIIHKTYVMKKIMLDIDDYLNILLDQGKTKLGWEHVPQNIKHDLDIKGEIYEISIIKA